MVDGIWLYRKILMCNHLTVKARLYNDWIRTNTHLTSFLCEINGPAKEQKLHSIQDFIDKHHLPIVIEDIPSHEKEFKLRIIK